MFKMADLLRAMMVKNASDLFITANATPSFKVDGRFIPLLVIRLQAVSRKSFVTRS